MDARIEPLQLLGLELGDAHILRNAGAVVTDDVLRSLEISHTRMGTREVMLIGHTDCALFPDVVDAEATVRAGLDAIRASARLDMRASGHIFDIATGELREVG